MAPSQTTIGPTYSLEITLKIVRVAPSRVALVSQVVGRLRFLPALRHRSVPNDFRARAVLEVHFGYIEIVSKDRDRVLPFKVEGLPRFLISKVDVR